MEVKPGFLEPEKVSLSSVPLIEVTLDNNLSIIHAIYMKMNWQPPKPSIFFFGKILVTTPDIDNREIAKASGSKKTKETNFGGRKTWKFYIDGEKMRNANSYQGENERQWKEQSERKTYNMSFTKLVTRKFHVVLMKKQRRRNVQKSVLTRAKFFFFSSLSPFCITRLYFNLFK